MKLLNDLNSSSIFKMSSTFVADSKEDKDDSLIIIVNADGTLTVDPETLQKLIGNLNYK